MLYSKMDSKVDSLEFRVQQHIESLLLSLELRVQHIESLLLRQKFSNSKYIPIEIPKGSQLEKLAGVRKAIVKESGKIGFNLVFNNIKLQKIISEKCSSLNDLRKISGLGEKNIVTYGKRFLDVLKEPEPTQIQEEVQEEIEIKPDEVIKTKVVEVPVEVPPEEIVPIPQPSPFQHPKPQIKEPAPAPKKKEKGKSIKIW